MRFTALLLMSTFLIAGCSQQPGANQSASLGKPGMGILDRLRPKTDPAVVERMHEEEAARIAKQKALEAASQKAENEISADGVGHILPKVSTDPIAPPAEEVAQANGPIFTPASQASTIPTLGSSPSPTGMPAQQPTVATYGANVPPPPPNGLGGGLVPPPPAVTLSTQAQMGAGLPVDPAAMYANPYMNPYGMPYPQQMMMPPQQQPQQMAMGRPPDSPFGGGGRRASSEDDEGAAEKKKNANFVPITPTGMESRSSYKQRDDLKALWNGVLKSPAMSLLMKDDKFSTQLNHVDVGLPGESTKGSFSISQRQVDSIFKNAPLDKRILQPVRKLQSDMVQAYYRYLYSYNKFALAQQTVAARKQEVDVAGTASEQQRAAADLSQAQNEAESAKDDMKSAQSELSLIAGPQAARYIIAKVSGVAPNSDALAQAEAAPSEKSGGMFGMFHFGGGGSKKPGPPQAAEGSSDDTHVASAPEKKTKEPKEKKSKKRDKNGNASSASEKTADLAPAPEAHATEAAASPTPAAVGPNGISFELKNVNVTARKSILTVSIHNGGANNFSFSPDVISISEGNHKLSEAAVRADFDQTMVQPNQEVKGTITIFGRPWNDRLAVSLADGSKTIQMSRR